MKTADYTSQVFSQMADNGIEPPAHIEFDGSLRRYGKDKACWYAAYSDDPVTVVYGDWRQGNDRHTWTAKGNNQLTPTERQALRERIKQAQRKAQEAKEADYRDAAQKAAEEYYTAPQASSDHQYLQKKGIRPPGEIRQTADGRLIVPVYGIAGNIQTLQYIDPTGGKLFLKGGKTKGGFFTIGDVSKSDVILICEGMATAASLFEATGHTTIAAMNAGNLKPVSEALNNQHQTKRILICADKDTSGTGEKSAQATGYQYVLPDVETKGDFNDMAASKGLEAVKQQVDAALQQPPPTEATGGGVSQPEPLEADIGKPAPYPIDALPPILRDAAKAFEEHVQCATELAAFAVIGAANHVAQSRVNAQSNARKSMPCSLFTLSVCDSGERKTTAFNMAMEPIQDNEKKAHTAWRKEAGKHKKEGEELDGAAFAKHMAQAPMYPPGIIQSDGSYERVASLYIRDSATVLSVILDEAGQFLGGHSMKADNRAAVIGGMTKLFDDGFVERVRGRGNADGSGTAYDRRFALHLSGQMAAVRESLSDPLLQGQGLLPRFLICTPEPRAGTRLRKPDQWKNEPEDDERLKAFWQRLEDIFQIPIIPDIETGGLSLQPIPLSQQARQAWDDVYNETEAKQARLEDYYHIKPFASRAGELVARLACTFAFFQEQKEVTSNDITAAWAIVEHSLSEWLRYITTAKPDKGMVDSKYVSDWLVERARGGETWQQFTGGYFIQCGPDKFRNAKERDRVFKILIDKKHLFYDPGSKTYSVNPLLLTSCDVAKTANSAKTCINRGLEIANDLLKPANNPLKEDGLSKTLATISKPLATANPDKTGALAGLAKLADIPDFSHIMEEVQP